MHKCKIFVGNSHPELGKLVCERLGCPAAPATLKKFANGETSVSIGASVRDEDVYIIQSGSPTVNDHIMELLILISACKSGSASKITAVIPQFPYSKQSKMKKHRGAITARMLANLLIMAGADHVVSMDLHASQMQGFFSRPVDNLYGAPILANWIVNNVDNYQNAVVVSKNPGGTKRVTALADKLKINFAMIHTDRRRAQDALFLKQQQEEKLKLLKRRQSSSTSNKEKNPDLVSLRKQQLERAGYSDALADEDEDEDPGDVILSSELQTARVIKGHIVDDDYEQQSVVESGDDVVSNKPVSSNTTETNYENNDNNDDYDDDDDDDDDFQYSLDQEDSFEITPQGVTRSEKLITLVGDVKNRPAIILDDMIDKPNSFIAAAEHCRLNCGASSVIVIATHGVFSNNCLEKLNDSPCIDKIVVTNTYPISKEAREKNEKLIVLDVSPIFAECIRRDHYGESISVLFDNLVVA
ncbi:ribose phosphate diphosphokinase subunit [Saccharomycopsis crataegensis]|uniref:Ribose-phosphate pyrophosphokinase 1 n=1 Tax=Saccharomycopsis crataegensis TaxID=43959 RepID=A0AAV5QL11_9ASCO|nr:ribose phosphate diphosphokinase subunit [Saccharomycopsis crataegensis]